MNSHELTQTEKDTLKNLSKGAVWGPAIKTNIDNLTLKGLVGQDTGYYYITYLGIAVFVTIIKDELEIKARKE